MGRGKTTNDKNVDGKGTKGLLKGSLKVEKGFKHKKIPRGSKIVQENGIAKGVGILDKDKKKIEYHRIRDSEIKAKFKLMEVDEFTRDAPSIFENAQNMTVTNRLVNIEKSNLIVRKRKATEDAELEDKGSSSKLPKLDKAVVEKEKEDQMEMVAGLTKKNIEESRKKAVEVAKKRREETNPKLRKEKRKRQTEQVTEDTMVESGNEDDEDSSKRTKEEIKMIKEKTTQSEETDNKEATEATEKNIMELEGEKSEAPKVETVKKKVIPIDEVEDVSTTHGVRGRMEDAQHYLKQQQSFLAAAKTPEEAEARYKHVQSAHDQIAEIKASEKAESVKAAEIEETKRRAKEEEYEKQQLKIQIAENEKANESAEAKLAGGTLRGQSAMENKQTGLGSDINMVDAGVRPEAATSIAKTEGDMEVERNQQTIDKANSDKNQIFQTILSEFNEHEDTLMFNVSDQLDNNTVSANAIEASIDSSDAVMKDSDALVQSKRLEAKTLKRDQENNRKEIEKRRKDVKMSTDVQDEREKEKIRIENEKIEKELAELQAIDDHFQKEIEERDAFVAKHVSLIEEHGRSQIKKKELMEKYNAATVKLNKEIELRKAKINEISGHIEGFTESAKEQQELGLMKNHKDPKEQQYYYNILQQNAQLDPLTVQALPSQAELQAAGAQQALQEGLGKTFTGTNPFGQEDMMDVPLGGQEFGTPVMAPVRPNQTISLLQQQEILRIDKEQQKELLKELQPFWNEFKLGRLAAGVMEAEVIGTNMYKKTKNGLKAGSKVRDDMNQREESFGNFMFFVLHHKFGTEEYRGGVKWRKFFMWAAALGYNQLTEAQINWLVTGNMNGDLSEHVDLSSLLDIDKETVKGSEAYNLRIAQFNKHVDQKIELFPGTYMGVGTMKQLDLQTEVIQEPVGRYPSRSISPSAAPVDNSIHVDGSTGPERLANKTISGIPAKVYNIPDPHTSERGGVQVPNTREVTVRNRDYDPTLKPTDPKYQEQFVTMTVPDIGVGSKDIQARVEAAEADRVLASIPQRLYAPIHAQAVDRYLGSRNFKRLAAPDEQYFKVYSEHGWTAENTTEMFQWNVFVMKAYGTMLYAFVTDVSLMRDSPVFDLSVPGAVILEFKELNELMKELQRYQEKSEDRADRISSGQIARPIERALDNFFRDRKAIDEEVGEAPPNAIVVASDTPFGKRGEPGGTAGPTVDPNSIDPSTDSPINAGNVPQKNPPSDGIVHNEVDHKKAPAKAIDPHVMNYGITNKTLSQVDSSVSSKRRMLDSGMDLVKRQRMFNSFSRR